MEINHVLIVEDDKEIRELSSVCKYYVEYDQYAWNQLDHLVLPAGSFLLRGRESSTYIYR